MVERLCRDYGTPLLHQTGRHSSASSAATASHTDNSSLQSGRADAEAEQPEAREERTKHAGLLHDLESGKTEEEEQAVPDLAFYAFPTLEQLSKATEAALRAEGFGYRCDAEDLCPACARQCRSTQNDMLLSCMLCQICVNSTAGISSSCKKRVLSCCHSLIAWQ